MDAARKRILKRVALGAGLFLLLFVVCNDLILPWYVQHGSTIEVPDVVGLTVEEAISRLDSAGLEGREGDVRSDREHPEGTVVIQNPVAGHAVKEGRRVYLTVSGGEVMAAVPGIRGRTLRDATFLLERSGLRIGEVMHEPSEEYPVNTVIEQSRAAGSQVRRETRVNVVLSMGPAARIVIVPDLVGKTLTEARRQLEQSGLSAGNVTAIPSADLLPNTVVEQYPPAGDVVEPGQAIDLVVVRGAASDRTPPEY